jgi:hypothetical protein
MLVRKISANRHMAKAGVRTMRRKNWTIAIALMSATPALASGQPGPSPTSCSEAAEIVWVQAAEGLSTMDLAATAPAYEVTYRHCGTEHRVLIQPVAQPMRSSNRPLVPMFF